MSTVFAQTVYPFSTFNCIINFKSIDLGSFTMSEVSDTVEVSVQNGQEIEVLNWFKQNKTTLERMLGVDVVAMSLSFDSVTGYKFNYTKSPVVSQPTTA